MKLLDNSFGIVLVSKNKVQEPKFLIIQENAGHWGFPKGHPESNETEKESAIRELFEETGISDIKILDIPIIKEEYDYNWGINEYHKTVGYFLALAKNEIVKIDPKEIKDYRWVTFNEALETLTYGNTKNDVLKKAKEYLDMIK